MSDSTHVPQPRYSAEHVATAEVLTAERWLAREGFADSRAHSSCDIAHLIEGYVAYLYRAAQPTPEGR